MFSKLQNYLLPEDNPALNDEDFLKRESANLCIEMAMKMDGLNTTLHKFVNLIYQVAEIKKDVRLNLHSAKYGVKVENIQEYNKRREQALEFCKTIKDLVNNFNSENADMFNDSIEVTLEKFNYVGTLYEKEANETVLFAS